MRIRCDQELRIYLGAFILVQGLARVFFSSTLQEINVFPVHVYGVLQAVSGLMLITTAPVAMKWHGRLTAACACALHVLLLVDIWGLWVSSLSLLVQCIALAYEVQR